MDNDEWMQSLSGAGFGDIDSPRLALVLYWFAVALRDGPLESFTEVNERVGTANGIAGERVRQLMDELARRGYLLVSRGVQLTPRGVEASAVMGVEERGGQAEGEAVANAPEVAVAPKIDRLDDTKWRRWNTQARMPSETYGAPEIAYDGINWFVVKWRAIRRR